MKILRTIDELKSWRAEAQAKGSRVGFVPTMGYLHPGHVSLVAEARRRVPHGEVMLSIFVNPTQFAPGEDLAVYPRDEAGDLEKAAAAGANVAFCPLDPELLYSPGPPVWVSLEGLDQVLCGASRPTHFRGVCTVVSKLFNLVRADVNVFGQKDFQQLAIIRRMHKELFFHGEVVGMPIVREADGVAMSSRNAYLSKGDRVEARALSGFLKVVRSRFGAGERQVSALVEGHKAALCAGEIDYLTIADAQTLESLPPAAQIQRPAVLAMAVKFDGARLLDNTVLDPGDPHAGRMHA